MQSWLEFWNRENRIFVNARHLAAHYERIADDVLRLLPQPAIDLLDWGCGAALGAPRLADAGARVTLYDAAPAKEAQLSARFGNDQRIRILDNAAYAALPARSFEVILVNSVIQYLPQAELEALLLALKRLIRPGGRLIIGDVVPPNAGVFSDAMSLLRSGAGRGYFFAALCGLAMTAFSDYRKLRTTLGLSNYPPEKILALYEKAGYRPRQLHHNIGFAGHRLSFEGQVPPD